MKLAMGALLVGRGVQCLCYKLKHVQAAERSVRAV
jgi:hypothetical protein